MPNVTPQPTCYTQPFDGAAECLEQLLYVLKGSASSGSVLNKSPRIGQGRKFRLQTTPSRQNSILPPITVNHGQPLSPFASGLLQKLNDANSPSDCLSESGGLGYRDGHEDWCLRARASSVPAEGVYACSIDALRPPSRLSDSGTIRPPSRLSDSGTIRPPSRLSLFSLSSDTTEVQQVQRVERGMRAWEPNSRPNSRLGAKTSPTWLEAMTPVEPASPSSGKKAVMSNPDPEPHPPPCLERRGDALLRCEEEFSQIKKSLSAEVERLNSMLAQRDREIADLRKDKFDEQARLQTMLEKKERELADIHSKNVKEKDEISRVSAALLVHEEELSKMKARHASELTQAQDLLKMREDELASLRATIIEQEQGDLPVTAPSPCHAAVRNKESQNLRLESELQSMQFKLQRLEAEREKELEDCVSFVRRLALSSSCPALEKDFDFSSMDILGMGNYGFVFTCSNKAGNRVVVKLQSERWASVAVKEWGHGSEVGRHPHIVQYIEAIMHRDAHLEIQKRLEAGFDKGILTGKRPQIFPNCYFCLTLEYMDRGTVQDLMDKQLLTLECKAAITQQVASALSFMHRNKRTHNDIKPENILLREAPTRDRLIAKLADMGLADYSIERRRDRDLFGYTVWCTCFYRKFQRVPSGKDQEDALAKFHSSGPAGKQDQRLWRALGDVVRGMWRSDMSMAEVENNERLRGFKIKLPKSKEVVEDLEASAKRDVEKRSAITTHRWQMMRRSNSLPELSIGIADFDGDDEATHLPPNLRPTPFSSPLPC